MATICDQFCFEGRVFATDESGAIISMQNNLVVNTGKELIADNMLNGSLAVLGWMAVGTDAAVPDAANTTLGAEVSRKALATSTKVGNVVTYEAVFEPGEGTADLKEAALFNASGAGIMGMRANIGPYNKGALDRITLRWEITVG